MKENEEKNKALHIVLLIIGTILFIALFIIMSPKQGGSPIQQFNGLLAQIQVVISTLIVTTNRKRGLITVCILNALSSMGTLYIYLHIPPQARTYATLSGILIPIVTIITMSIIYVYLSQSETQKKELTEQYEQIMDSNRLMQEKDEAMKTLAYTDRLTGMRNMQYFHEQIDEAVRLQMPFSIIYMDIDNFKGINDTFGPKTGDTALVAYAERVSGYCGRKYACARSGDEFAIMLTGEQTEADILNIIEQLRRLFGEQITVQGANLSVTASYGIVVHPRDGRNSETLIDSAVMAVYNAKANGKDRPCFFSQAN